ncbi:hypothetical protein CTI12_AA264020 [Artemisia annua]|uniref:SWIM-type domain-containing protein n=1 Tax=Artemisia annua TaxID=35608 RepID=A0A2U1NI10_ARTAN|nr:hypothetical protein CTI12_AA264020 [Artemisia annua]
MEKVVTRSSQQKKGEGTSKDGEGTFETPHESIKGVGNSQSPKWTKSKISGERKKPVCGFRLQWMLYPSGFQELKVRIGDESYGVNIHMKLCMCRLWQLSGVPCVHSVAGYMHLNREPDEGVDHWYNQEKWFEAYQFSIKPVYGSNMWKRTDLPPLLPLIMRRMPGIPRKKE